MQQFFNQILNLIESIYPYINYWYIACAAALAFAVIWNISINKYRQLNKQTVLATTKLRKAMAQGTAVNISALAIPKAYSHQWRILRQSEGVYPSQAITFKQIDTSLKFIYLSLSLIAFTATITLTQATSTLTNMTIPLLLIGLVALSDGVLRGINNIRLIKARKIFFLFITTMDNYFGDNYFAKANEPKTSNMCLDKDVNAVLNRIEEIKLEGITDQSAQEISTLLNSDSLKKSRTPEQQKKINLALNGILHQLSNKNLTPNNVPQNMN